MPCTSGNVTSNLDPLTVFNMPIAPDVMRGGGKGIDAGGGLFDNFVPQVGSHSGAPTTGSGFLPDFTANYSVAAPAPHAGMPSQPALATRAAYNTGTLTPPQSYNLPQQQQMLTMPSFSMPQQQAPAAQPFQMPQLPQMDSAAAQWLANLQGNNKYLENFAQNGQPVQLQNPFLADIARNGLPTSLQGSYLQKWAENGQPVDALPAWQSYVDAMGRNVSSNQANLMEMFNASGGYQSTSFGNAAVDYMTQTNKDQNALLAQMGYQSLSDALGRQFQAGGTYDTLRTSLDEAAAGRRLAAGSTLDQLQFQGLSDAMMRQYGAAQALGQQAYGAGSTLANFDFQSQMAQYQSSLQAAMAASGAANNMQMNAANMLGNFGNSAANSLLQNALGGVGNLFGGSQQALNQMFGAGSSVPSQLLQSFLTQQGQGLQGNQALMNAALQNLGLGGQLGQQQYNTLQGQLGALYQEWMRTQAQYNPLLPYMFQGATGYVPMQQTSTPGFWDYFTNILGSGIGAAGSIIGGGLAGGLFSDERMKENIIPIGYVGDVPFFEYDYTGFPGKQVGTLAQEVVKTHPNVVYTTGDGTMLVDYVRLAHELMLQGGLN